MFDGVEREVITALDGLPASDASRSWTDPEWTRQVKIAVGTLGQKLGYEVRSSEHGKSDRQCREWLFDVVWLAAKDGRVTELPLILESEWNPRYTEIDRDFQKLLVGRADHRVMVFQQEDRRLVDQKMDDLKAQARTFRRLSADDRILLCGYDETQRTFSHLLVSPVTELA